MLHDYPIAENSNRRTWYCNIKQFRAEDIECLIDFHMLRIWSMLYRRVGMLMRGAQAKMPLNVLKAGSGQAGIGKLT
jgi:hypothetical protein